MQISSQICDNSNGLKTFPFLHKWLKVEMQKAPNVKYCWQSFCKNIDHFKQCNKLKTVEDVTFSCNEHVQKYFLCLLIAI